MTEGYLGELFGFRPVDYISQCKNIVVVLHLQCWHYFCISSVGEHSWAEEFEERGVWTATAGVYLEDVRELSD